MSEMISKELAEALLSLEGENIQIYPGLVAPRFPDELRELDLQPLGSAILPRSSASILSSPETDIPQLRARIQARLIDAGFTNWSPSARSTGFASGEEDEHTYYMRREQMLTFAVVAGETGSIVRVVTVRRREPVNEMRMRHMQQRETTPMPRMRAPAQAFVRNTSGGSSGGFSHTDADVETKLSVTELVSHYEKELASAGWLKVGEHADATFSFSAFYLQGAGVGLWSGMLSVNKPAGSSMTKLQFALNNAASEAHGISSMDAPQCS